MLSGGNNSAAASRPPPHNLTSELLFVDGCDCIWTTALRCARPNPSRCWELCCKALAQRHIIGMGLSKTGTTSVAIELSNVGFRVAHNMRDILARDCQVIINTLEDQYEQLDHSHPDAAWIITYSANVTAWVHSLQNFLAAMHKLRRGGDVMITVDSESFLACRVFGCSKALASASDDPKRHIRMNSSTGRVIEDDVPKLAAAFELYYERLFEYFRGRNYAFVDVREGVYRGLHELIHPRISVPFGKHNVAGREDSLQFHCLRPRPHAHRHAVDSVDGGGDGGGNAGRSRAIGTSLGGGLATSACCMDSHGNGTNASRSPACECGCVLCAATNYFFMHIPTTAGSSISALLPHSRQVGKQSQLDQMHRTLWGYPKFTPWHLPADVYELWLKTRGHPDISYSRGLPLFCVVRNPKDRLMSRLRYMQTMPRKPPPDLEAEAKKLLRDSARPAPWVWTYDNTMQHAVPQAWYVWNQRGQTQCRCVIEFGKATAALNALNGAEHKKDSRTFSPTSHPQHATFAHLSTMASNGTLPRPWYELHHADLALWQAAKASPTLCYTPPEAALFDQDGTRTEETPFRPILVVD